jgi:hypothetical protein
LVSGFGVEILVHHYDVIDVVPHAFEGIPRAFGHRDLILQELQALDNRFFDQGMLFAHHGGLALFLNEIEGPVGRIVGTGVDLVEGHFALEPGRLGADGDPGAALGAR